jgi:hypothetical protein
MAVTVLYMAVTVLYLAFNLFNLCCLTFSATKRDVWSRLLQYLQVPNVVLVPVVTIPVMDGAVYCTVSYEISVCAVGVDWGALRHSIDRLIGVSE